MTSTAVACFGEMLLRLAPEPSDSLQTADSLRLHVAGAEANVAIGLAALGTSARMITVLPENSFGDRALRALRSAGVDAGHVVRKHGRMGLFFIESPRAGREGGFFYDRADSAFVRHVSMIDWASALAGARWLHLSGLTAALGDPAIDAMREAVTFAKRHRISISFDCNFRPLLWEGREREAASRLGEFAASADLLFGSGSDARLILGAGATAETLMEAFPSARWVAATVREDCQGTEFLGARLLSRRGTTIVSPTAISPYVDRIGAGDAFAAGLLHALNAGRPDASALSFAHAACHIKHATPGDFSTSNEQQVQAAMRPTQSA